MSVHRMSIVLLGADGQVGYELHRVFAPLGTIAAYTISGLLPGGARCGRIDFAEAGSLAALVAEKRPAMVLNAVAHTQVDRAEDEPALAQRINADAGVRWNDARLAIDWPIAEPSLSDKDARAPFLDDIAAERLPEFIA